ncbi:MAG TPA: TetR family transcriptional regulator [Ktedonobacterales bacterium]|nr:TetR family transcriptional regulator [Ktedonobacterales bacterium]
MRKTAAEAAETRQAILRAALDEFSQRGYSATTLDGIARAAGVTRGAVYWHFASKAALYEELLRAFGGQAGAIMGAAAAEGGDFITICQRILTRLLTRLEEDRELRAVMELSLFKTEHTAELAGVVANQRASMNELIAQLAGIMQAGIAQGALRAGLDPWDVARGFLAYQQGIFHLWLTDPDAFSLRERASALADLFIRGIRAL